MEGGEAMSAELDLAMAAHSLKPTVAVGHELAVTLPLGAHSEDGPVHFYNLGGQLAAVLVGVGALAANHDSHHERLSLGPIDVCCRLHE
jgi:hypothetical protein